MSIDVTGFTPVTAPLGADLGSRLRHKFNLLGSALTGKLGECPLRKTVIVSTVIAIGIGVASAPAPAQYVSFQRVILGACYDPAFRVSERERGLVLPYINKAIDAYAAVTRSGGNIDSLFGGNRSKRHWSIDGVESDPRVARDPWASASIRFQLVDFIRANAGGQMTARWNAIDSDGHILGTYDAVFIPGAHHLPLMDLQLSSPRRAANLQPLKSFCEVPGDIEKRQAEKVKQEAEKAARAVSKSN